MVFVVRISVSGRYGGKNGCWYKAASLSSIEFLYLCGLEMAFPEGTAMWTVDISWVHGDVTYYPLPHEGVWGIDP